MREQCHVGRHGDGRPGADDDDAAEGKAPIALREPREVRSDSLQSPHDPQVTYSGHKGKGYEVQVAETCESDNAVQMITHVEVTPSSGSDSVVTTRVIDELSERGIGPSELWADTSYGSGRNGWEAERRGTELVSPVGGRSHKEPDGGGDEPVRLTASDFYIDAMATRSAVCPAGHGAVAEYEDAPERVEIHFARAVCEPYALRTRCPVGWRSRPELGGAWSRGGAYVLSADQTRQRPSSLLPGVTRTVSTPRLPSPPCVASIPYLIPRARPTGIGSTVAATATSMRLSIASLSSDFVMMSGPRHTCVVAPPRE